MQCDAQCAIGSEMILFKAVMTIRICFYSNARSSFIARSPTNIDRFSLHFEIGASKSPVVITISAISVIYLATASAILLARNALVTYRLTFHRCLSL